MGKNTRWKDGPMTSAGTLALRDAVEGLARTQEQMARRLGVTAATVSRWLNGERRPNYPIAMKIKHHTGIAEGAWYEAPRAPKPGKK